MRQSSISIGRILGIDVRIHLSWLLAFAFVAWGLATGYFRFISPRQSLSQPLLLGVISALLLFASVLVHEFSHSLVAKSLGMRVRDITLFIFGGVSNIAGEARTARQEFLISIVGPLTSFALAAVFWIISRSLGGSPSLDLLLGSLRSLRGVSPTLAVLNYLVAINLLLGAFNLVPAFPLDGGRVFRSVIWAATRRYGRATNIATTVGQGFGIAMIGLGVLRFAYGDLMGGLWTGFIGWFLVQAAGATRQDRSIRESLRGVSVGAVMDIGVPLVRQDITLQQLVNEYVLRTDRRRMLLAIDGVPLGVIETSAIKAVPRAAWPSTSVRAIARPVAFTCSPETDASDLLARLDEQDQLVPVVSEGRVVGGIDAVRLLRLAELRRQLQVPVSSASAA